MLAFINRFLENLSCRWDVRRAKGKSLFSFHTCMFVFRSSNA